MRRTLSTLAASLLAATLTAALSGSILCQQPVAHVDPRVQPLDRIAVLAVDELDRPALADEDVARHALGLPARYAVPFRVDATPLTHGTWERLDATWSLWRLRIEAPGSNHVNLGFTAFKLPPSAQLMVYAIDASHIVRPFHAADATDGQLWTPVVMASEIVVELYVATAQLPRLDLRIGHVGSGYRFFGAGPSALGTDGSGTCNIDVVCPQGAAWTSEIPSVAAISTGGSVFCTGFMVNNTAQDGRNYFMTAFHCGISGAAAPSLVCYWNYQNTVCGGPDNGTFAQFNTGSTLRAGSSASDFTLVELTSAPNPAWGVTYAGWSRGTGNATSAVCIHHPSGDEKKISFETSATQVTSYSSNPSPGDGTHVRVVDWDTGTTEPGSSGSPLFDQNHRVIGQLHGGGAACGNNLSDWYGRFATSWTGGGSNSTRLSNWLDPLGTGTTTLDTRGSSAASATAYGTGCYERFATFQETFAAGTFDLGGSVAVPRVIRMTPAGGGYAAANAPAAWDAPTSANLGLGDDAVSGVLAIPFSFSHPGGTTTQLRMCSNGFVWLNGTSTGTDFTPTAAELVAQASRFCALWMDLNPAAAGTTHYHIGAGNAAVFCTWLGVPSFAVAGSSYDVQLVLRSNGQAEFRWRSTSATPDIALVGYSPGNGVAQPPSRDISATLPFNTGPDSAGLGLVPLNRPVQGTNVQLRIENIPAGAAFGAVFLGFTQFVTGVDLGIVGMPGCRQYASTDLQFPFVAAGATHVFQLGMPTGSSWNGVHLYGLAAVLSPGVNTLGALASNGVDLRLAPN